jgi:hypothetical protein
MMEHYKPSSRVLGAATPEELVAAMRGTAPFKSHPTIALTVMNASTTSLLRIAGVLLRPCMVFCRQVAGPLFQTCLWYPKNEHVGSGMWLG